MQRSAQQIACGSKHFDAIWRDKAHGGYFQSAGWNLIKLFICHEAAIKRNCVWLNSDLKRISPFATKQCMQTELAHAFWSSNYCIFFVCHFSDTESSTSINFSKFIAIVWCLLPIACLSSVSICATKIHLNFALSSSSQNWLAVGFFAIWINEKLFVSLQLQWCLFRSSLSWE